MEQGFSKANRLLKATEFKQTLSKGSKVVSGNLVLVASRNDATVARLGLVVSRKVGNAVIRNRIKRFVRESFRRQKEKLAGLDVVIIARPQLSSQESTGIYNELDGLITRIVQRLPVSQSVC